MANVTGLAEFRAALGDSIKGQRQAIHAELATIGDAMASEIRQGAPKLTGALAASVRYEVLDTPVGTRLVIHVGDQTAFYAGQVEFGHWSNTTGQALTGGTQRRAQNRAAAIAAGHATFTPPRPFVRPVVYRYQGRIQAVVQHGLIQGWGSQ